MTHPFLAHYPYRPDSYDELIGDKDVRPHWQAFVDHIEETGTDTLRARSAQLERGIQQNGVTYNVYADPRGAGRPWSLDLLPLILPADEWRGIATAIAQAITIVGIPLALANLKLIPVSLLPLGKQIVSVDETHAAPAWPTSSRRFARPGGQHHGVEADGARFRRVTGDGGYGHPVATKGRSCQRGRSPRCSGVVPALGQ